MFTVTSDPTRNRLYITLAGYLDDADRQAAMKAILAEVAKLTEGFGIVTDITGLHATNKDGFKDLLRIKSALKLRGAGHVVRVVKIALSHIQMARVSEEAGYETDHVDSLEEADRRLDEWQAQPKTEG